MLILSHNTYTLGHSRHGATGAKMIGFKDGNIYSREGLCGGISNGTFSKGALQGRATASVQSLIPLQDWQFLRTANVQDLELVNEILSQENTVVETAKVENTVVETAKVENTAVETVAVEKPNLDDKKARFEELSQQLNDFNESLSLEKIQADYFDILIVKLESAATALNCSISDLNVSRYVDGVKFEIAQKHFGKEFFQELESLAHILGYVEE